MPTPLRPVIFAAAVTGLVAALATPTAQSPNAFGVPSADQPQPGAAIKAVPGSRAQGWLAQGRSEVLARHDPVDGCRQAHRTRLGVAYVVSSYVVSGFSRTVPRSA